MNRSTGDVFEIPNDPGSKSLYRFNLICKALDRLMQSHGLCLYFLSLTLADENVDKLNTDLNKFLNFLRARFRRAGLKWFYLWVVELQKKRYYKSGVKALHWHFAIICPDGVLPNVRFNQKSKRKYEVLEQGTLVTTKELYAGWGYGQVFCMRGWSKGVYAYLSKYFTKDYGSLPDYNPEWSKLRRFGSSQVSYFRFPKWAYEAVQEKATLDESYLDFVIRKEGARVNFYGYETYKGFGGEERTREVRVDSIRSPWALLIEESE